MALESSLWKRCRDGAVVLRRDHKVDLQRVENVAVSGHPDVEGCIDGAQVWIELKSCSRPVRPGTPIQPKKRISQGIWHRERANAGCRCNWILIQVGEGHKALLYLIPGCRYDEITVPEYKLALLSVVRASAAVPDVLLRAAQGW
jgi:hypothetical protein